MGEERTLDVRGLLSPHPVAKARNELLTINSGDLLIVVSTDPRSVPEFQSWVRENPRFQLLDQAQAVADDGEKTFVHRLTRKR